MWTRFRINIVDTGSPNVDTISRSVGTISHGVDTILQCVDTGSHSADTIWQYVDPGSQVSHGVHTSRQLATYNIYVDVNHWTQSAISLVSGYGHSVMVDTPGPSVLIH